MSQLKEGVVFKGIVFAVGVFGAALPSGRAATGTIQDVQHVVILMKENRSFDHYYGMLQGVRGFNDPNILVFPNGNSDLYQPYGTNYVLPFHLMTSCLADIDHTETTGLEAWAGGKWNQWAIDKGPDAMTCLVRTNLAFYYALADAYTICDANFSSFIGLTFPNRLFLFTGTIDPNGTAGGPALNNTVPTNGFSWTTYPERLQAAGISWRVYRPPGDWFGDALPWFAQYMNAQPGNPLYDRGVATVPDVVAAFKADVTNGTLPQVSWIIPTMDLSEHPPGSPNPGENFTMQLFNALAANPAVFNSTVFIITYDENGGFFDHVPPPVPPPGTTNEYVHGQPLGLGARVPMLIISPWSRGGRVCSQVFDHTSIIRFLEAWTGVLEPNISAWRRQACGDLTSAFDFAHPDTSRPNLPGINSMACLGSTNPVPNPQFPPVQEPGVKIACPLPYQPNAYSFAFCDSNRLYLTMTNTGTASVHFAVYANAWRTDGPWQFDAPPGGAAGTSFVVNRTNGLYDFTCYGPNGFQRRFAGNLTNDCNQIEVFSLIDIKGGSITLNMLNTDFTPANFNVTDNYGLGGPWTFSLPPGGATNSTFPLAATNNGWYDFTVTADTDPSFIRRLAGHIETGAFSTTELPVLVTNVPPPAVITDPPPPPAYTITNVINAIIANNLAFPPPSNLPVLSVGYLDGSCALVYPDWASNYVIESRANLVSGSWTTFSASPMDISNFDVVVLPATNAAGYFRLRQ